MVPKLIVVALLLIIIVSMGSSLVFMLKDRSKSDRTLKALTLRIGLSILAFAILIIGAASGYLRPHGLLPNQTNATPTQQTTNQ